MTDQGSQSHHGEHPKHESSTGVTTAVLEVKGLHWGSEKAVVEATLSRLGGVRGVDANPVAQTATVSYDPAVTSVAKLRG